MFKFRYSRPNWLIPLSTMRLKDSDETFESVLGLLLLKVDDCKVEAARRAYPLIKKHPKNFNAQKIKLL